MKPTTCPTDGIPSLLLEEGFRAVGRNVLDIINQSLVSRVVPNFSKHAVLQALLKKPNLDPDF